MWRPDLRTRFEVGGVAVTYLAGDTEGAYLLEGSQTVVVYPARNLTTAKRRRIITTALAEPDPVCAAVGALVLAGLDCDEVSVDG